MSACPSQDQLHGLLNECLDGPELAEIVIHIETCPRCQEQLEDLTRGHGWKTTAPEVSGERGVDEGTAAHSRVQLENDPGGDAIDVAKISAAIDDPDPAGGNTDPATTDNLAADPDQTVTQSAPQNGSPGSESGSPRTNWPKVPGYEIPGGSAKAAWASSTRRGRWG